MKERIPTISDAEFEIMKIIWTNESITANEIYSLVDPEFEWSDKTVKSMINRLLKKNVITYSKNGQTYIYRSVILEEMYKQSETSSFLEKIYDGSVNSMLLNILKVNNFSVEEIDELKNVLENKKGEKR